MPDWKRLVRGHLNLPPLHNQRAERIIEEIAGQLDDLYQEARRHGASSAEAVRAAFAQTENWEELSARIIEAEGPNRVSVTEQRREEALDRARAPRSGFFHRLFGGIGMDIRLGLRRLAAAPTSTAIAVGVLTLAIGAGTAVFSVVDAVALRGLPFDEYDRLAAVLETDGKGRLSLTDNGNATPLSYFDWRRMQTAFDGLAAFGYSDLRMRNEFNEPATARGLFVSAEFFAVLRVAPLIGRPFRATDEVIGQHRVAILSYAFWQRQFGGARDVVGRTMRFNDEPWQIVGVMPRHFTYPLGGHPPGGGLATRAVDRDGGVHPAGTRRRRLARGRPLRPRREDDRLRSDRPLAAGRLVRAGRRAHECPGGGHRSAESGAAAGSPGTGAAAQ
jgi:hypothetical protein